MKEKRVTIKDIAKAASVSETTVSRFLNKKFEYMSIDTKKRIEGVVKELNYRPSNIARSLKSNKSNLYGAIIADIENPFSNLIIKGLIDQSNEFGYSLMIAISNNSVKKETEGIRTFLDYGVDGLIINAVSRTDNNFDEITEDTPVVLIDRNVDNYKADLVSSNNYDLSIELMDHLIESKFKSIGYFSENIESNSVREIRYKGFKDKMEETKDINSYKYIIDSNKEKENLAMLEDFLTYPAPRVIVAGNGLVQMTLLQILIDNKYEINKDFYFAGFDDYSWSKMISKNGITSVSQDSYSLGKESINILYNRTNQNRKEKKKIVQGKLIIRGSTKIE